MLYVQSICVNFKPETQDPDSSLTVLDGLTLHRRCVGAVLAEQPLWLERAVWQRLQ